MIGVKLWNQLDADVHNVKAINILSTIKSVIILI